MNQRQSRASVVQEATRHALDHDALLSCSRPAPACKNDEDKAALIEATLQLTRELGFSSFHSLLPTVPDQAVLSQPGMQLLHRTGFQYHWNNDGYKTFDDFLAAMTHDKRKKIRQERRKLETGGIRFRWVTGTDSTPPIGIFSSVATPTPTPAIARSRI